MPTSQLTLLQPFTQRGARGCVRNCVQRLLSCAVTHTHTQLVDPPFRSVCTADRGVNTQVCEHLAKVVLTHVNTWQKWVLIQLYEQCVNVNPGALGESRLGLSGIIVS